MPSKRQFSRLRNAAYGVLSCAYTRTRFHAWEACQAKADDLYNSTTIELAQVESLREAVEWADIIARSVAMQSGSEWELYQAYDRLLDELGLPARQGPM